MEESLDKVAENNMDFIALLKDFYSPFKIDLDIAKNDTSTITVEDKFEGICPQCKSNLVSRFSKFGKFIACSSYPKCKYTKSILKVVKGKLCPKDGGEIVVRFSKNRKRFYGCSNYPKCNFSAWTLAQIDQTNNTNPTNNTNELSLRYWKFLND